ncbi:MAG: hypothetical protein A2W25_06200 [candidate division Zixibacteria bacterium RBG_16_53_22]|nr:MAG: hypothetical protein A2W25_06200 [candidate division Zixibacteria bacterium RBG_16_53_22]
MKKRISESLHLKIALLILSILTFSAATIFYTQYRLSKSHLTNSLKVSTTHLSNTLLRSFEIAMLGRRLEEIQQALEEIGQEPQIDRIFIVNKSGEVKVSSDRSQLGRVIHISERTCQVCHEFRPADREQSIIIKDDRVSFLRSVNPIRKKPICEKCHRGDETMLGMLVTDVSVKDIEALTRSNLNITFVMIVATLLFMAGAFRLGFKKIILDRLALLKAAAGRLEKGDFSARAALDTGDELGRLAGTFNRMADNLTQSLARIERARAYLENLINSIDDGVAVIKRDRTLVMVNDAYLRMFDSDKRDRSEYLNSPLEHLNPFHGEWCRIPEKRCNVCTVFETGEFSNRIVSLVSRDGAQKVYESYISVLSKDEQGVVEIVEDLRDTTIRKKFETQMIEAERLVSAGKLAAGVAHEINNPMASISTCAEGLLKMIDDFPAVNEQKSLLREYLETIRDSAFRCKAITQRLLNFASIQSSEFEPLDFNEVIEDAVRLVQYDISAKGVDLELKLSREMPSVRLSRTSFPHAVVNLILNSLYAVERRGKITITTLLQGQRAALKVEDNGCGIDGRHLQRVFEPFFTTKKVGEGSGLGLFICRNIVNNHGGEIDIQSEAGKGTVVTIRIPVTEEANG